MQKIVTNLWFNNNALDAAEYYCGLIKNSKITNVRHYGKAGARVSEMPEGSVLGVEFTLDGQSFVGINGGPVFQLTPAVSLYINCQDQAEADRLYEALSEGGEKMPCGWVTDKYGLSWQVVPMGMEELVYNPDPEKAERAMAAMLKMTRLDLEEIRRAMDAG